MNREVKGVLVFGSVLILVLAGFYISYISLKENLPEGETFTTFVGNAMKQFSRADTRVQQEKYRITKADLPRKPKIGDFLEALAIDSCFKNSCYDTDGGENFNLKGKVYVRKRYQVTLLANDSIPTKTPEGYPVKKIGDKLYQCAPVDDYCKATAIIEQSCGNVANPLKTTLKECPCGCANGVCNTCPPKEEPDLFIKEIVKTVHSEMCLNSFTFTICNQGDADVTSEFMLTVEANNVKKDYLVKQQNTLPKLTAGGCAEILVGGLFSVGSFGLDLNQNAEVTVTLDTTNIIVEKDETNNGKTETVFTGDAYYFNENLECDTYCYESDAGEDLTTAGKMTYKYNGDVNTREDECSKSDPNQLEIHESYCNLPISLKTNGKLSNPSAVINANCLGLSNPHKCNNGQCVLLDVQCEDAYGKLGPCLQCSDNEASSSDPSQYQNSGQLQILIKENKDPFVKGTVDYTNIDNIKGKYEDVCESTQFLVDNYCSTYNKYPLLSNNQINCYRLKKISGEGHVCIQGVCAPLGDVTFNNGQLCSGKNCEILPPTIDKSIKVNPTANGNKEVCIGSNCKPVEIGFEECAGPTKDQTDPFNQTKATETKLLGEKTTQTDYCSDDGDSVVEFYCDGKYINSKKTSCDNILDSNGMGASCVKGKCVFFDASMISCTENGDKGPDFSKTGTTSFTTGYGFSNTIGDDCNNEDILVETYCSNKEPIIVSHSCKEEGKICKSDACI
ncbi:hypothetical protein HYT55_03960 [Candidatus Woesearchaeota archaeon]|nr:hypothetical protein [Candidatus Woesearchaeota archaeon]